MLRPFAFVKYKITELSQKADMKMDQKETEREKSGTKLEKVEHKKMVEQQRQKRLDWVSGSQLVLGNYIITATKHINEEINNKNNIFSNCMKLYQASVCLVKTVNRLGETYVRKTNTETGHLHT